MKLLGRKKKEDKKESWTYIFMRLVNVDLTVKRVYYQKP